METVVMVLPTQTSMIFSLCKEKKKADQESICNISHQVLAK